MVLVIIMEKDFIITEIVRVISVGKEKHPDRVTKFRADLKSNELIFQFSGNINVKFGNQRFNIGANSVRFLPEGNFDTYEVEKIEASECIDVFFKADRPISSRAFVIDATKKEYISGLFRKLFAVWVSRGDGYYFECISLLYKIFAELQKSNYIPASRFEKIEPAVNAIRRDFLTKSFEVSELAAMCSISESYLKRIFKEKFGLPPKKYIIQLKINHACELLSLGGYSVSEVAEICNFSDVYYFSKVFKEICGVPPSRWK